MAVVGEGKRATNPILLDERIVGLSALLEYLNTYSYDYWGLMDERFLSHFGVSPKEKRTDFYGILKEIIKLDYSLILNMQIVLFKCHWVDPVRGMKVHLPYHFVDINFNKVYQKNEPFILTQQAEQIYYTEYPSMKRDKVDWMAVCKAKARRVIDDSQWTKVAFREDETIPTPQVMTDNHNYDLHDPNDIQLVVELFVANQQGTGTSHSTNCEFDNEFDEYSFDKHYETEYSL
ncbi:hypothetical protein Sango_2101900 [Sesamum angolense]|uniref:DUF4216 domain-containing protein n=1 Tax=Sesamum angolense TaxID=2727404 RepID=A0AAE1WBQ0_9LAMI|nr:hypothetical protein Sango_2101900 [Sesamum angolense]